MYYSVLGKGTNLSSKPPFWCVYLPPPPRQFRVKVFLNFSLPAPCPSPQESALSAAGTASQIPSPAPSDFHPIRRRPHRIQTLLLGSPETRGPAPGVVCEWGGGEGAGQPGTPRSRRFFWRVARLRGVTLRFLQAGGGGGSSGPRDSRATAARGWKGQAQAAGTQTSQLRTRCNWISKKNSLSSWFQGTDWTQSENQPFG